MFTNVNIFASDFFTSRSSLEVERQIHNLGVVGSSPASATNLKLVLKKEYNNNTPITKQ